MGKENNSCTNGSCSTGGCHKKMLPIMIIMILLIALGIGFYQKSNITEAENIVAEIKTSNTESLSLTNDSKEKSNVMMNKGEYVNYSPETVKNAKGKIVLFFYADWCPSCKATDKDILSKKVPDNLTILKVNFDNSTDLKQKYGVLAQTTFVQIDKDGNEITKWVGGDLEDIISSVK